MECGLSGVIVTRPAFRTYLCYLWLRDLQGSTTYILPPLLTTGFSPSVVLMSLVNTRDGCGLFRLSVVYDPLLITLLGFGCVPPVATETDNLFVPRSRPLP